MHDTLKTRTRAIAAVALTLALGSGLTACGKDTSDTAEQAEGSTTEHNDADVTFAGDMIQHHAQALSMVDLTLDRPLDPEVQALADDIRAAQAPEIETMADWLTTWGEKVPETMRDHANAGHDMDDMDGGDEMPGMMTADEMDALENATDSEFQDMWLEMMVEHHEGAVEMAETERSDGQFKNAIDLAGQIIDAQRQEIDTMQDLLASWAVTARTPPRCSGVASGSWSAALAHRLGGRGATSSPRPLAHTRPRGAGGQSASLQLLDEARHQRHESGQHGGGDGKQRRA